MQSPYYTNFSDNQLCVRICHLYCHRTSQLSVTQPCVASIGRHLVSQHHVSITADYHDSHAVHLSDPKLALVAESLCKLESTADRIQYQYTERSALRKRVFLSQRQV